MRLRVLALVLVLAGALPASAAASEISFSGDRAFFNALAGEQNGLVIQLGTDNLGPYIEFDDTNEIGGNGPNCEYVQGDRTLVRCDAVPNTTVNLGDGNDAFNSVGSCGGAGCATTDTVDGGPGDDNLIGWEGNDSLSGGPGDDFFDNYLLGANTKGAGADTFSGGDGVDLLEFGPREAGVNVTLNGRPDDGHSGEGDNVGSDVEIVKGTAGNDRFVGSRGRNRFEGSAGNDLIFGRGGGDVLWGDVENDRIFGEGGNDVIRGGDNSDRIDGGRGRDVIIGDPPCSLFYCRGWNDVIRVRDRARDTVICGVGLDIVTADRRDRIAASCEGVSVPGRRRSRR
jgi:Ca2+-binding RTX toxin-like protein